MIYIERIPEKCFNMPSLIGRRLTVYDIVTQINGDGIDLALEDYQINLAQAKAAVEYCNKTMCKIDFKNHQFCDGCKLRSIDDNYIFNSGDYSEVVHEDGSVITFSKDGLIIFSGSIQELLEEEEGIETWKIAELLMQKYF